MIYNKENQQTDNRNKLIQTFQTIYENFVRTEMNIMWIKNIVYCWIMTDRLYLTT